jgi:thiamine-monophosphate kinase
MSDEDRLIQRIARSVPSQVGWGHKGSGLSLGIGDDAAVLNSASHRDWVVSCDAFNEGVHFLDDVHPPDSVGYKALVRATSDLVAMGAAPRAFLLTLVLPTGRAAAWLDGFLKGMGRAARHLGMHLVGGDCTVGRTIGVNVTVFGLISRRKGAQTGAILRSGAHSGDRIYVSGALGRAQLGLELVRRGHIQRRGTTVIGHLLQPHLYPRLRVELGLWLARHRIPSAMMDLSDGLSSDLARLCRASGVGAKLTADRIPVVKIPETVSPLLRGRTADPVQMALHGGDDYELLFTVPAKNEKDLRSAPDFPALTCIGEIIRGRRTLLVHANGKSQVLRPGGWDPFRK